MLMDDGHKNKEKPKIVRSLHGVAKMESKKAQNMWVEYIVMAEKISVNEANNK